MKPSQTREQTRKSFHLPEAMILPGEGVDRRSLLLGASVRTRVTSQEADGTKHSLIIVGGAEQGNGSEKGDRPPLVIHEQKFAETGGHEGVAVLPYDAQTLKAEGGVFVDEEITLGVGDSARNFGKVLQVDHVPSMGASTELTPAELAITRLFEGYQATIVALDRGYNTIEGVVAPNPVLP